MTPTVRKGAQLIQLQPLPQVGARLGRITTVDAEGRAFVDFPGNTQGPVVARTCATAPAGLRLSDATVLLNFENDDPALPVITGFVQERLIAPRRTAKANLQADEVTVDGRQVTLEGRDEVVLRCGQSSITLTKDGRVVVKGVEIVSRASRTNKIKGGNVNIN
jgi:hypothetical protein